jgi:transposase-like protein
LNSGIIKDNLLEAITLGISQHDYKRIVQQSLSSFGLSQSSVSRNFQAEAEESLKEFENRDLSKEDIIALLIDGKTLASQQIVICMGVTLQGEKRVLGLLQTESENSNAIKGLFRNIINRGLDYSKGLLCIVDGSKGIEKALRETFGKFHIIQRCRWHKIENVCSHFKGEKSDTLKRRMNLIFKETDYDTARSRLLELVKELEVENISASRSLREGLEQTLTLQKLQMEIKFSTSFGTTNCIESLNSQIGRYVKRITRWKNSKQIFRWTGLAIIEAESRMNRIRNYKHLPKLRESLMNELKLKQVNKKNYKAAS